ncbi:MAG: ATP-binding protein [Eubacteriales bacterium]|nr:ATP-binding protein [Eubacteriales bacterium]
MQERVGASIVEIITESLYDKPIVVFREYVQNSADSLRIAESTSPTSELAIKIWKEKNSLYFLDNGTGIAPEAFESTMGSIADSSKIRSKCIGYKGIGRLSGLSYCQKLTFVNIVDYKQDHFQTYTIDCQKYTSLRKSGEINNLQFAKLMDLISVLEDYSDASKIKDIMSPYDYLFKNCNTGFLVILDELSPVLNATINEKGFLESLSWLLPVTFEEEMLTPNEDDNVHELFSDLSSKTPFSNISSIPAKSFNISYNNNNIRRPIKRKSLRGYLCKSNLDQYAVCVHTFSNSGIAIDSKNSFSGIRMYIDNILLCDESELIPALQQFGMISHTVSETIQTVRGIGAVIYIVDKVNISANARRTFIDVTDEDSFDFLKLVGEFVENVYQARYALSNYYSAKKKEETTTENLNDFREKAENALLKLASYEITIEEDTVPAKDFLDLSPAEKRRIIKSKISKEINARIKRYIDQIADFNLDTCFEDFITWLKAN